jgi:hypothetical protein
VNRGAPKADPATTAGRHDHTRIAGPISTFGGNPKPAPSQEPRVTPSSSAKPSLSAEVALIQQATRALASGEPDVAQRVLDAYDREFPDGLLHEEAGVLRAQALARSGDDAAARKLARKLLATHPGSVLAPSLRAMADDDSHH